MSLLRRSRGLVSRLVGQQCAVTGTRKSIPDAAQSKQVGGIVQYIVQPFQLRNVEALGLQFRLFRASGFSRGSVQVEIQSMGESITEGTIAEILKKEGESVAEDETIAQIETDKVTIDIKSPVAGKVAELKMAVEDTVRVGQVVAVISEGEGGSGSASAEAKPADSETASAGKEQPQETQSSASGPDAPGYKPGIKFPPRMTPGGDRISDLSAEDRSRYQQDSQGSSQGPPAAKSQPPPPPPPSASKEQPQEQKTVPWYVGKEQGTKLSQSRVLSQREMEQIELGGADP